MEALPEELRTPPLGAVALVGLPNLHTTVNAHLRSELRPPLHSTSVASVDAAAQLFPARKPRPAAGQEVPPAGILRADWLAKHRLHRPAVALVFLSRDAVAVDATHAAACAQAEAARATVRRRGAALVLALVSDAAQPLPDDKLAALCRRSALDARFVVSLAAPGGSVQLAGLRRLALLLQEAAAGYYRAEGARVAAKLAPRGSAELAVRHAFKAAVYAEFRQDWASALQLYRAAEAALADLAPPTAGDPRRWQRWYERSAVAEWCHVKCITLLLHTTGAAEAVTQLHRHVSRYRRPPPNLPPALRPAHWGFVLRQFSIFAALLEARPHAGHAAAEQPAVYYAAAADAGLRRRQAWAVYAEVLEGATAAATPPLVPGLHVGQLRRADGAVPLSDEDFGAHLASLEKPADYVRGNLESLSRAHTLLTSLDASHEGSAIQRTLTSIMSQMADEHLCAGDSASALRLLRSVAAVYRREGWTTLLAGALASLRDCAGRLSMQEEHALWSLELGCLHAEGAADAKRAAVLAAAIAAPPATPVTAQGDTCFVCVGGLGQQPPQLCVALFLKATSVLPLHGASAELLEGDRMFTVPLTAPASLLPHSWATLQAALPSPSSTATMRAVSVLLHISATATLRVKIGEPDVDADPVAPADSRAAGLACISRHGAQPGVLSVSGAPAALRASLALSIPTKSVLAGAPVRIDVALVAEEQLSAPTCSFHFGASDAASPLLLFKDEASGTMKPLVGPLSIPDSGSALLSLWACWQHPCAPQNVAAALSCSTPRGVLTLEVTATGPVVVAPLALACAYTTPWLRSCLLHGVAGRLTLPLGQPTVLEVRLRAEGALTVLDVGLEAAPGWTQRASLAAPPGQLLQAGDVHAAMFEVTPHAAAGSTSPGVIVVHWLGEGAGELGLAPSATRLPLQPVAAEDPQLSVVTQPPTTPTLGVATALETTLHNHTPLPQDLTVAVADAAGFVFAGERVGEVLLLPRSVVRLQHTLVAHTSGPQALPVVTVTSPRLSTQVMHGGMAAVLPPTV